MKNARKQGGIFLLALLLLLMTIGTGSVFASEYIPVTGGSEEIQIHKKLEVNSQAVPTHSVTFKTTYEQASSEPNTLSVSGSVPDVTMNFVNPTVELKNYLDFSKVTFSTPGNYCFKVTESSISLSTIKPVPESETSYYIWVHVVNGDVDAGSGKTNLVVNSYSAASGKDRSTKINYDDHEGLLFENEWDNYNLYVEKKVEGLQGDKTKPFTIKLHLRKQSNKPNSGGALPIKIHKIAGTPKANSITISDSAPYTTSLSGTTQSTIDLQLKDGDKVFVDGLNDIVEYAVTEPDTEGYTSSGTVGSYTPIKDNNGVTVTVVNTHKNGNNPPTGLFINNWPYISVILVVLAACVVFLRRRKARYEYEADL